MSIVLSDVVWQPSWQGRSSVMRRHWMGAFAVAAGLHVAAFAAIALRPPAVSLKASEPAILVDMVPQEKPEASLKPTQHSVAPKTVLHSS
ncbi:MAG: hypothetical protein WCD42_10335, partial [Rhizomicrobium sp.]